jgi:hypothetical protein
MTIQGEPGAGKTTLLSHYARNFVEREDKYGVVRPIVFARCPASAFTWKAFAAQILEGLKVDVDTRASEADLMRQIIKQLTGQRTQLLVLEDMQRLTQIIARGHKATDIITDLCEDGRTPIVIAGQTGVSRLIRSDPSLRRRIMADITLAPFDWLDPADQVEATGLLTMLAQAWRFPVADFELDPKHPDNIKRMLWAHGGLVGNIVQHMKRTEKRVSTQLRIGVKRDARIYMSDLDEAYLEARAKGQTFEGFEGNDNPFDRNVLVPSSWKLAG